MRTLYTMLMILLLSGLVYAETCPTCGRELPSVSTIQVEKNIDGNMKTWTEISETGTRVDAYTYYPTGEIKEIVQKRYDSRDKLLSNQKITHYIDSKAPTVENISVSELEVSK